MNQRRFFISLLIPLLVWALSPARFTIQAEEDWSVWLFNRGDTPGASGQPTLARIYLDGATEEYVFPVPEGATLEGPPFAFSANGNWIAFCVTAGDRAELVVDNLYGEVDDTAQALGITAFPLHFPVATPEGCLISSAAFKVGDDSRLVFGALNSFPGSGNVDPTLPQWEIRVVNLASGAIEAILTPDQLAAAGFAPSGESATTPMTPLVRSFGETVIFNLLPYSSGGGIPEIVGYAWNPATGVITPDARYDHSILALEQRTDAAGAIQGTELVWATYDESVYTPPAAGSTAATPRYNTVQYTDVSGATYPIFVQPDGIGALAFVNDGRLLVVRVLSFGMIAIDRSGARMGLPIDLQSGTPVGAPGGYVFVDEDIATLSARLIYHQFAADGYTIQPTVLWQATPYRGWTIVWRAPMTIAVDLRPFPGIGQP